MREMEGGPGKEKDIIGSSAQGFGTDLVIIKNFFNLYHWLKSMLSGTYRVYIGYLICTRYV